MYFTIGKIAYAHTQTGNLLFKNTTNSTQEEILKWSQKINNIKYDTPDMIKGTTVDPVVTLGGAIENVLYQFNLMPDDSIIIVLTPNESIILTDEFPYVYEQKDKVFLHFKDAQLLSNIVIHGQILGHVITGGLKNVVSN